MKAIIVKHENRIRALEAAQKSQGDRVDTMLMGGGDLQSTSINNSSSSAAGSAITKGSKDDSSSSNLDVSRTGNGDGSMYITSAQPSTLDAV